MEIPLKSWSCLFLSWGIGGVFIIAGGLKVLDPVAFVQAVEGYRIILGWPASAMALYLPWLEIFCGAGLVLRRFYAGALALLMALTVVFIVALLSAWMRGLDIECGCFGPGGSHGKIGIALARDVILLGAMVWLWRQKKNAPGFPSA